MTEEWIRVEGFPGYSVSPFGRVRNDRTGRILNTRRNQYCVPYVGMMREGRRHQCVRSLPLLVASTFIPQPRPHWDTPINLDGDRNNCHVDNLAWRPRRVAEHYNNQFLDPYENPIMVSVRNAETDEEYPNSLAAACANGITEREVVLSILNNTPTWPTFQRFVVADDC